MLLHFDETDFPSVDESTYFKACDGLDHTHITI